MSPTYNLGIFPSFDKGKKKIEPQGEQVLKLLNQALRTLDTEHFIALKDAIVERCPKEGDKGLSCD